MDKMIKKGVRKPLSVKGDKDDPKIILGVESVLYWTDLEDYINLYKKGGTVFFMDIDEEMFLHNNLDNFVYVMQRFSLSHLLFMKTRKGYHVICFDIREYSVAYFELFRWFKVHYNVDYEYSYKWILRLSEQGDEQDIKMHSFIVNHHIKNIDFSVNHLMLYLQKFGELGYLARWLKEFQNPIRQHVKLVKYLTWNY